METELFVSFAEIAGVFVGFGALISVRSEQPADAHDVVYLQGVLGLGVQVVFAALLPIAVSRYGVQEHTLWFWCALVALATWATLLIAYGRTQNERSFKTRSMDRLFPVLGVPLHVVIAGAPLLIAFGVWPSLDEALYVTALTAGVVFAGYALVALVLSQNREAES